MIARTITHCRDCGGERMDGDPHWCAKVVEPIPYSRQVTLSAEARITIRVALQRHQHWLEECRERAKAVGQPSMVRQAEIWLQQNSEALNELEM